MLGPGVQKAFLPEPKVDSANEKPAETEIELLESNEGAEDLPLPIEENPKMAPSVDIQSLEGSKETELLPSQKHDAHREHVPLEKIPKIVKRRKNKGLREGRLWEKERKASNNPRKVDLAPQMVRAHQAAYAYLNPNISKYETLLCLLDQAAQTQLSLQPMMTAVVLRFEEVNQALEEMAEEGELMLKEHGDYLAWPAGIRGPPALPAKPSADIPTLDPPPDLLQQLLQHSTEKMRLVGSSVQGLGDTTLEETVEYYSSLSKLLSERLQAKQAAERRLTQVLARVEVAAVRKFSPEDLALHSEDSGIESLTGSERHRRQRGSSGSGSTGSGSSAVVGRTVPLCYPKKNEAEDEEEEEDPSQPQSHITPQNNGVHLPTRPLSAAPPARPARPQRSNSSDCLKMLLELQRNQKELDHQMKNVTKGWSDRQAERGHKAGVRRHSSGNAGVSRHGQKGPLKACKTPSTLPMLEPHPPGRNSVRRLINSFSHGVDGRPGQSLANIPPHIRGSRRSTSLLPDIGNGEGSLVNNGNNNNNGWPTEGRDDLDVDSLPPPPPEVLMDNSYESMDESLGDMEGGAQEDSCSGHPTARQRTTVTQRLRASMQNVTVLPNRSSLCPRQDAGVRPQHEEEPEHALDHEADPDKEQAASLYRQARKIIHLRNAAESPQRKNTCKAETYPCNMPPTTPPVSRVRLPPSCPSVHHRLPNALVFTSQPSPPTQGHWKPSSRPGSPRSLIRTRVNSGEEIIPSMSFCDARSVFCQQSSETPSSSSTLPRPWGETSRGRQPVRGAHDVRRTQSDRRPSLTSHPEVPVDLEPRHIHSKTNFCPERTDSPPMAKANCQSDASASVALHPEQ
ncbi:uncharacterized protein FYW47_012882 [Aplochiton taeniatus]